MLIFRLSYSLEIGFPITISHFTWFIVIWRMAGVFNFCTNVSIWTFSTIVHIQCHSAPVSDVEKSGQKTMHSRVVPLLLWAPIWPHTPLSWHYRLSSPCCNPHPCDCSVTANLYCLICSLCHPASQPPPRPSGSCQSVFCRSLFLFCLLVYKGILFIRFYT